MSLKKLGRYDLIRVLGKGAMGLVYEGRDPNLERRVAIKTIKVENLSDEAAAEYEVRFRTEARSAARLQHPNIVSVYDSDRDIDIAYLVMEFVEGEDLKHHLDAGHTYTLEQTLRIMADLLSALSYAHQQNVVHRDIKPANLLVIAGGHIKLADFGVARIQDSGDTTRTQGTIIGTLKYMSPEQLEGKPIDARTDLFAAGVVLYQLVTGQRPFDGETDFAVIQKIVSHKPAAPTSFNAKLPPALDAVVAKALAKARDARYATAQDFADALQAACKQASDITIAPIATVAAKGSNTTWTATMMPGESLLATQSGMGTNSGLSASLVTQEVELVYWKDIKDSGDIEDLQGFLDKFPSGIYADLARRRLKSMGVAAPLNASEATLVLAAQPVAVAQAEEKTLLLPRFDVPDTKPRTAAAPPEAQAVAAATFKAQAQAEPVVAIRTPPPPSSPPPPPLRSPATTVAAAPTHAPSSDKKSGLLWAGSVAALAAIGIAFTWLSGPGPTPVGMQTAAPLLPASAAASSPVSPMAVAAAASAPNPTLSAAVSPAKTAASGVIAMLPAKVVRPMSVASKAAIPVVAKLPAMEEKQPIRQVQAATPESAATAPAPKTASVVGSANPKAACDGRILIGFLNCMNEQCAKPAFTQHPQCVERRAMEDSRKEAERNR